MTHMFRKLIQQDERGVAIIEFAYVAPVFLLLMMATFDLGHRSYVSGILNGEVQKAARDATLETGTGAAAVLDAKVKEKTARIVNGTWSFQRKNYVSFTRAGQAEKFTDANDNGLRDPGECFQDENASGTWDTDAGRGGQGGADDIVVYTVSVTYPRLFPMHGLLGWSPNQVVSATTVLRNQPFGPQAVSTPVSICT